MRIDFFSGNDESVANNDILKQSVPESLIKAATAAGKMQHERDFPYLAHEKIEKPSTTQQKNMETTNGSDSEGTEGTEGTEEETEGTPTTSSSFTETVRHRSPQPPPIPETSPPATPRQHSFASYSSPLVDSQQKVIKHRSQQPETGSPPLFTDRTRKFFNTTDSVQHCANCLQTRANCTCTDNSTGSKSNTAVVVDVGVRIAANTAFIGDGGKSKEFPLTTTNNDDRIIFDRDRTFADPDRRTFADPDRRNFADSERRTTEVPIIVATASSTASAKSGSRTSKAEANAVSRDPFVALARATASAASKSVSGLELRGESGGENVSLVVNSACKINPSEITAKNPPKIVSAEDQEMAQRPFNYFQPIRSTVTNVSKKYESFETTTTSVTKEPIGSYSGSKEPIGSYSGSKEPIGSFSGRPSGATNNVPMGVVRPEPIDSRKRDSRDRSPYTMDQPKLSRFNATSTPEPERIAPPSEWRQAKVQREDRYPKHFLSSEQLQKMLEQPYYEKQKSRETVFPSEGHSTPVSYATAQAAPPKKPLPLIEKNLEWWSNLPDNRVSEEQKLMRWRNSMNLAEDEVLGEMIRAGGAESANGGVNGTGGGTGGFSAIGTSGGFSANGGGFSANSGGFSANGAGGEIRPVTPSENDSNFVRSKYQKRVTSADPETEAAIRASQRNRYRAKIDRAKKDFLSSGGAASAKGSASDLYKTPQEFEEKFKISMESLMRPVEPPRGPLLSKFNSPYFKSQVDITLVNVRPRYVTPKPLWDKEYDAIAAKADRMWRQYRLRVTPAKDSLYSKNRAYSTGYLETDVDTGFDQEVIGGAIEVKETDIDYVHRSGQLLSEALRERQSRSRTKSTGQSYAEAEAEEVGRRDHSRARSMDYIMDRLARRDLEPPENELQKLMADAVETPASEHSMRFRKSLDRMHVPDWYVESEYCPGGKPDIYRGSYRSRRSTPSLHSAPYYSSPHTPITPEPNDWEYSRSKPMTPVNYRYGNVDYERQYERR